MVDLQAKLNVVDENDEIIGKELRSVIHQKGLLHRESHVLFYTPKGEIIFQHRAKNKDTYPDLLDATVGGHVEIGETYESAALKETKEETGLSIGAKDLSFLKKIKKRSEDEITSTVNYAFKSEYAYCFTGKVNELTIENGKAIGFEAWPIDLILNINDDDRQKFIPAIFSSEFLEIFRLIKNLIT